MIQTPYALLKKWFSSTKHLESQKSLPEQSPAAALLLHWIFCMVLIAATSSITPDVAYTTLVSLYSYIVIIIVRFFMANALLYLRYAKGHSWLSSRGFRPWGGPIAAMIYSASFGFLLIIFFIPPVRGSPFAKGSRGIDWYVVPSVGFGFLALGYIYYLCFAYVIPRIRRQTLEINRAPVIVREEGEWVQVLEVVQAIWIAKAGPIEAPENGESKALGTAITSDLAEPGIFTFH